jgi:hypothetical protein
MPKRRKDEKKMRKDELKKGRFQATQCAPYSLERFERTG